MKHLLLTLATALIIVGSNPVLIRIETDAGHGAGTPVSKAIEQAADRYSFAWYNMGIIPDLAKKDM